MAARATTRRDWLRSLVPHIAARVLPEPEPEPRFAVMVIESRCVAFRGRACTACVGHCAGEPALVLDGGRPRFVAASGCDGCGLCAAACPQLPVALAIDEVA